MKPSNISFEEATAAAYGGLLAFQFLEKGRIRPVLDRTYPVEQIAEAHRYVETGHKRGGVAVTLHD